MHQLSGEWQALHARLASDVEGLAEGERLRVGEPKPVRRPAGLLRQRRVAVTPTRYVLFVGGAGVLTAECVGSTSFGGTWEMSPDVEKTLQRQGWGWPLPGTAAHFRRHAQVGEAIWLVESGLQALELLGLQPADVSIVRTTPSVGAGRQ